MAEVIIRTIKGKDVGPVVKGWNGTLTRDTITEERFVRMVFLDPDLDPLYPQGCWVAEKEGKIAGFIRAIVRQVPNDGLGLEEDYGWLPVIFVAPWAQHQGIGSQLLEKALVYLKAKGRKRVWFCGNTGSAPGYIFPGVDKEAYLTGLNFLLKRGFVVDHEPVAMSRSLVDFDYKDYYQKAWAEGVSEGARIDPLTPHTVLPFLAFLRQHFPGDWNTAARAKLKSGSLSEVLIATYRGEIVGYCQWEGEHFGPFGVRDDMRGKRIGAKLQVEAMRRIKAEDGRSIWFNWADEDAARFYRRLGFEVTRSFAILRREL